MIRVVRKRLHDSVSLIYNVSFPFIYCLSDMFCKLLMYNLRIKSNLELFMNITLCMIFDIGEKFR